MDISRIWHDATERVKDTVIHPTLWRALELAVPIVAEEDTFVVGFGPGSMHMAGHLNAAEHKNAIEAAIAGACGKPMKLVVVDGNTLSDWEHFKARMKATEEARSRNRARAAREMQTSQTWESTFEQLGRAYAALSLRQLPQVRGRYIDKALALISDAMDELYNEDSPDEPSQRALARVIDRVGTLTEVPPAIIALELVRYRQQKRDS